PPQQDPPPAFSTYTASFFTAGNGPIVSHDPHLNEDGEALYRFLLAHSSTPPTYHLHVRGTHKETRTRIVDSHHHHGGNNRGHRRGHETRTETHTEVIVDFDFRIDLTPSVITDPAHAPVQWSVPDDEPAYRGKVYQQVEVLGTPIGETRMRKPSWKERKGYKLWCKQRISKGLPPWIGSYSRNPSASRNAPSEGEIQLKSSRTVRQWCDDYCASEKLLKEFVYTKSVYGWDFGVLNQAIETLIVKQTSYGGTLKVRFAPFPSANDLIIIRPTNTLSKLVSNMWVKLLLWITLIYPFIWLFKRFHKRGGGVWKVCGGGYPLKVVLPLPRDDGDQLPTFEEVAGNSSSVHVRAETYVIGEREGEWFRKWENTIRGAVLSRRQDKTPLVHPTDAPYINPSAVLLDGY
ncbi:hypothetical protein BDM02DRAFT_3065610, partial [Thelephora ganbajun]